MTFNTGNPIGSTDARDLSDNAENFDKALGTLDATWTDRLGVTRDSFEGRLAKGSFYRVGTFAAGHTLTNMRQTLEYSGHEYGWAGTFPKVVTEGATPATSGGIGAGAWVDRTGETLRSDINIVVKQFASVADAVADTSLVVGQNVKTTAYYNGWAATAAGLPFGGNDYVVVAAGTGIADGGSFIDLANGLQLKGLFLGGVVYVSQFGAKGDGETDDTSPLVKAIATGRSVYFHDLVYLISGTLEGNGGAWIGVGSGSAYSSEPIEGVTTFRLSGTNGGAAFLKPPTVFKNFHVDGQTKNNIGVTLGQDGSFVSMYFWENIKVRRCDIGIDCYNFYSVSWKAILVQGNKKGVRMAPSDTIGDDGYWTSTEWINVNISDNTDYGIYAYPPLGAKTFEWINVVIERNGIAGSYQAYLRNLTINAIGLYCEGTSTKPAIQSNSLNLAVTGGYFGGTGGIDATSNAISLDLTNVHFSSTTDVFSNLTSTTRIHARFCTIQTDVRNIGANVSLEDVTTAGVFVRNLKTDLTIGKPNIDGIQPTPIDFAVAYRKTITATIPANSRVEVITNQYHYGIWTQSLIAHASLADYQPGVVCVVTPGNTGNTAYFCVELINTTSSSITVSAKNLSVWFIRSSGFISL